jgi:hypothetical protein
MCKAEDEGGQRCATETKKNLAKAIAMVSIAEDRLDAAQSYGSDEEKRAANIAMDDAIEGMRKARIEHASTPSGAAEFQKIVDDPAYARHHQYYADLIARGAELRERNKAVGEALKAAADEKAARTAASAPEENLVTLDKVSPGDSFMWGGDVHVMDVMDEDDEDDFEVRTAGGMRLLIPKDDLVEVMDDIEDPFAPDRDDDFEQQMAWAREDEAEVTGQPTVSAAWSAQTVRLSADDFENQFGSIDQTSVDPDGNTYWDEPPTDLYPENRIWTVIVVPGNDNQYLAPGIHRVNREGYIASEKPWTNKNAEVLWFDYDAEMGN